jgi:hypothetical protein
MTARSKIGPMRTRAIEFHRMMPNSRLLRTRKMTGRGYRRGALTGGGLLQGVAESIDHLANSTTSKTTVTITWRTLPASATKNLQALDELELE